MSNTVLFNTEASQGMKKGIDIGANAVQITLGYGGRTVFIRKKGFSTVATKDGVTVINEIRLKDPVEDAGLKFIQDISTKTAEVVGDGTTSVCVLMREIINKGILAKSSGVDVMELKKGMERAKDEIVKHINSIKKNVGSDKKMLRQIATVSSNNDAELGDLIGRMFETIGKYGSIHVEDSQQPETTIELVNGFEFQSGFMSPYFINTPKNTCELMNPYVLVIEDKVTDINSLLPILEKAVAQQRSVVIMAEDFDHSVMANVLKNIGNKRLNASLIKYTVSGSTKEELLLDLCAITGAKLVTEKTGCKIESIDLTWLGQCEKVVSNDKETTVFNGKNNKQLIALRIEDAKQKITDTPNPFLKEKYEYRLAKLQGSVAICYVGGATEIEISEKKHRIDDAIRATKAAIEEGVVPGGGTALIRCIDAVNKLKWETESEKSGIKLVQQSIERPFFQICENAGKNGNSFIEKVKAKTGNFGYNAKTEKIEDLLKAGIIDPAKVVRVVTENAISGAIQFLMSECLIVEEI